MGSCWSFSKNAPLKALKPAPLRGENAKENVQVAELKTKAIEKLGVIVWKQRAGSSAPSWAVSLHAAAHTGTATAMVHPKTPTTVMRSNKQVPEINMNLVLAENHLLQTLRDPFATVSGKDLFYSNTRTRRAKHHQLCEPEFNRLDAKIQRIEEKQLVKKDRFWKSLQQGLCCSLPVMAKFEILTASLWSNYCKTRGFTHFGCILS